MSSPFLTPSPPYRPQPTDPPIDSLNGLQVNPWLLTGIYLQFLREQFGPGRMQGLPELRNVTWSFGKAGANPGGIVIEDAEHLEEDIVGMRPALVVVQDDWYPQPIGIDNRIMGGGGDGENSYETMWVGSHTIHCLGAPESPAMAKALGVAVAAEFVEWGPVARGCYCLNKMAVAQLGRCRPLASGTGYDVPVTISSAFSHTWTVREEAALLAKITLERSLESAG